MQLKKLGRYDLVRVLGKGAMGVVYEGRDPNLDRQVAIKTIMVDGLGPAAAAEYEERFRTEARSAARLQHPNIVTVYDSDRDGDTAFLVMEFVAGDDLKQLLDGGGRYAVADALHLVHDLLAALDFAHQQGVVHRDIKPANLLVEKSGRVKLTDFGVARIAGEATRTQGSMIGTLKYMAPEQVQGQKVDARADLFSAAVVTYQLLTGSRPFDGDNDFSIIHQVISHTPPAPSTLAPELPQAVDAVLARAMAKDREERFATAADFWHALREAFPALDLPVLPVAQAQSRLPSAPSPAVAFPAPAFARSPTVPGAGITQELELEYWRAVRDSTDPRELEGFLARFPEGIYADLARRRLQRLQQADDPEQTVLRGVAQAQPAGQGDDSTRSFPSTLPLVPAANAAREEAESLEAERAWQALGEANAPSTKSAAPAAPRPKAEDLSRPLPPVRRLPARRWAGAAAVVAGLAVAAILWTRPDAGTDSSGTASVQEEPAATAPVLAADSEPVQAPPSAANGPTGSATTAVSPASAVRPVSAAAQARAPAESSAARRTDATPAAGGTPLTTTPPAASATPQAPATVTPAARNDDAAVAQVGAARAPRLVPPSETCKDKFFLLKEFCLQSECAKPGYQSFPACIRLKEEARLREESRVRN